MKKIIRATIRKALKASEFKNRKKFKSDLPPRSYEPLGFFDKFIKKSTFQ